LNRFVVEITTSTLHQFYTGIQFPSIAHAGSERYASNGSTMRVLIVDDSEALVARLKSRLAAIAGLEITGYAANVPDAVEEIRKVKPDVVILDISMPGGSGIDVLESVEKNQFQPIVIMLSNFSGPQYRRKCLQGGARFFFDKSAEFHKVAEVLRGLMEITAN
jgi:DNA-binding NarL/FixJ family response regulator